MQAGPAAKVAGLVLAAALAMTATTACGGSSATPDGGAQANAGFDALTIDTTASYPWQGWGTSLAWWADVAGDPTGAPGPQPLATAAAPAASFPSGPCPPAPPAPPAPPGSPAPPAPSAPVAACTNIWSPAARAEVLNDLFGDPTQPTSSSGQTVYPLGLNVLRYDLGASPWELDEVTYPLGCGARAEAPPANLIPTTDNFSGQFGYGMAIPAAQQGPSDPVTTGWDTTQLSVLQQASALIRQQPTSGGPVVQAFATSPPWWMLSDACPAGGKGAARVDPGTYASYLARVVQAYQDAGIFFTTLEPFTNSASGQGCQGRTGCQEGAQLTATEQQQIVAALCQDLAGNTGSIVAVGDGATPGDTAADVGPLLSNGCVTQVDTRSSGAATPAAEAGAAGLHQLVASKDTLWMSEFGNNDAGALALQVADDLQELRPTAWVYWQPVGADQALIGGFAFGSAPTAAQIRVNTSFEALGQYSRYVRPGALIYPLALSPGSYDDPKDGQLRATVAVNPSGQIVVVATNPASSAQTVQLSLQPLQPGLDGASHQLDLRSGRTVDGSAVLGSDGELGQTLPPSSVTTFVFPSAAGSSS